MNKLSFETKIKTKTGEYYARGYYLGDYLDGIGASPDNFDVEFEYLEDMKTLTECKIEHLSKESIKELFTSCFDHYLDLCSTKMVSHE